MGEGPPFGETSRSIETTGDFTVWHTCSGSWKTLLGCVPPRARSCPGVGGTPRDAPQVEYSGPYRPARRELAIPEIGNLSGPASSLWRDSTTGRRRKGSEGCSLLTVPFSPQSGTPRVGVWVAPDAATRAAVAPASSPAAGGGKWLWESPGRDCPRGPSCRDQGAP